MSSEQAGRERVSTGMTEPTRSVPPSPAARDLLNGVLRAATSSADEPSLLVFFRAETVAESLRAWLGTDLSEDKDALIRRLNRDIATLDEMLSRQINALLHAPALQRLEAAWRGLHYLTEQANDPTIKVRILSVSWRELERDFERSMEFDQSEMFRKIYEQEFGTPGGEPFSIVIADFEVHPTPTATHPHNDINVVRGLAQVGAAAFCPIILNASPSLFGMDHFDGLQHRIDHASTFAQAAYLPWRTFRDSAHARFIGLTLPRILMRTPYADDGSRVDGFCFREDVEGTTSDKYLWGGAAFAFGEVALRAFSLSGWLADIRGFHRDEERGGLVTGLPVHCFATDKMGIAPKSSTDVVISEELERQLSDLGFMPLCDCKDAEYSVFYSNPSAQKPKVYDREAATVNARLSAMLQYMLCVSRFAHYIKVLGRDKTGAFSEATEFESYLQNWITRYITADADASRDVKARHPLRGAQVQVYPVPGKPGSYGCTMQLSPHYELDDLNATIRLQAELTTRRV